MLFQEPTGDSNESGANALSAATTLSGMIDEDRIAEMQLKRRRVRRMCARQRAATSQWWRDALQRYAQQRMWMHLGPPKQGQLPERFIRIHEVMTAAYHPLPFPSLSHFFSFVYESLSLDLPRTNQRIHSFMQPERLTIFEKWFSHEFAVPVPANPGRKASGGGGRQSAGAYEFHSLFFRTRRCFS